jgi:hypothetical protein
MLDTGSFNLTFFLKFGSLSPYEPRLVKKLQPPITELISTTAAISLLYECVHTCIIGGMLQGTLGDSLARMCVSKLAAFIQDTDQNRACILGYCSGDCLTENRSQVYRVTCYDQNCTIPSSSRGRVPRYDPCQRKRPGYQHPHARPRPGLRDGTYGVEM